MNRKILAMLTVVIAISMSLDSVQAGVIRALGEQDPTGFSQNNPSAWSRGWRFKVNSNDVVVTELGLNTPIANQSFELTLWDVATQSVLASVDTTSADDWKFESITPVGLVNGNEYIVSLFSNTGGTYYFDNNLPSSWTPTGTIEYQDMRYHNAATNVFPTLSLTNYQYGIPDIGYQIGQIGNVPEPTSFAMFGVGSLGILLLRRRRA